MNIIYMGDGQWAHRAFDQIQKLSGIQIKKVVLRFDSSDAILREKAEQANIEVCCPQNVNDPVFVKQLLECKADLGVSMSYNQIIKPNLMEIFPLGMINCHAGKLPHYRGRNVLNWALINGENEIGVTCHYIDEGIDTGDIILQRTFPVTLHDDYGTVLRKATKLCANVLTEALEKIKKGSADCTSQPEKGSYFIERKEGDEFINWSWNSKRVHNFVRAITAPGPYARSWIQVNGSHYLILIKKVNIIPDAMKYCCVEGGVVGTTKAGNPLVKTCDTVVEITDYAIDHKTKKKLAIGDRLGINHHLQIIENYKGNME